MASTTIDRLIVNSPYEEPAKHWKYDRRTRLFDLAEGRRPAGYVVASQDSQTFDDPGHFVEIPLVERIRPRVKAWRQAGWPGVTAITRRLLHFWTDPEEFAARRFFFCQLEAVETLIWLTEAPESERAGVEVPGDGGAFPRLCAKMATGSGKTVVMAMLAAWHILNRVSSPRDRRFSQNILVVAPGLTVRNRLAVLKTSGDENYYKAFRIVPSELLKRLRRGRVLVRNWHALSWETEEKVAARRGVDKRGARSDEAWVRDALGEMARARNLVVFNDEAHHAWRVPAGARVKGVSRADLDEATRWVGALDRLDRTRGVAACYDFSATPFAPSGKRSPEEGLFGWIVSDFGLNDAIEAGLVKTPRVVIRDDALPDAKTLRSRLYHIYGDPEVKDDLNRKAAPQEPLPDLVANAYYLLGYDWQRAFQDWESRGKPTPPVLITVANRTETAARVKRAFDRGRIGIPELSDPERTLHVDSRVLQNAEAAGAPVAEFGEGGGAASDGTAPKLTQGQLAERLRQQVDTVGQPGKVGGQIRNVISVGMLSEGWDARTVTHIMGLRAFTSQLLCEQVVGRGLRRTSYDVNRKSGLFEPEYVNIFGIPFTFLPHEGGEDTPPPPPQPKTAIEPAAGKAKFEISWPNILRLDRGYRARLSLDWGTLEPLELRASEVAQQAELAPVMEGKPDITKITEVDLGRLAVEFRMQRLVFETAGDIYDRMQPDWPGGKAQLIAQIVQLTEEFVRSDRISITPSLFHRDPLRRRLVIALSLSKLVNHLWQAIHVENAKTLAPVFDRERPILSTGDMRTWHTGRPCEAAARSHINFCVLDSSWEASEAFQLDHHPDVEAWVKNDHLGFEVCYVDGGVVRKYRPDFLIRLRSGGSPGPKMLVLETKGQERPRDRVKRDALAEWVRAVNEHGGFGRWSCDMSRTPDDIHDILARHATEGAGKAA